MGYFCTPAVTVARSGRCCPYVTTPQTKIEPHVQLGDLVKVTKNLAPSAPTYCATQFKVSLGY